MRIPYMRKYIGQLERKAAKESDQNKWKYHPIPANPAETLDSTGM